VRWPCPHPRSGIAARGWQAQVFTTPDRAVYWYLRITAIEPTWSSSVAASRYGWWGQPVLAGFARDDNP
jgi:hypothetical protein